MSDENDGPRPSEDVPAEVLRRGRRLVTIAFLAVVVVWVLYVSGQIVLQAEWPVVAGPAFKSCDHGLGQLFGAVERARGAAEGDDDADTALARYRAALTPEWTALEAARKLCVSEEDRRSLDAIERLRYAEEHAVRREAASLSVLRRQVASDLSRRSPPRSP